MAENENGSCSFRPALSLVRTLRLGTYRIDLVRGEEQLGLVVLGPGCQSFADPGGKRFVISHEKPPCRCG